jgi:hypothetical protein
MSILLALDYISSDRDKISACVKHVQKSGSFSFDEFSKIFEKISSDTYRIDLAKACARYVDGFAESWMSLLSKIDSDTYKVDFLKTVKTNGGIPYKDPNNYNEQVLAIITTLKALDSDVYKVDAATVWFNGCPGLLVTCDHVKMILSCLTSDTYKANIVKLFKNNILDKDTEYKAIINQIESDSYIEDVCGYLGVAKPPSKGNGNRSVSVGALKINSVMSSGAICFGGSMVQTGRNKEVSVHITEDHFSVGNDMYYGPLTYNQINFHPSQDKNGVYVCKVVDANGTYMLPVGHYKITKEGVVVKSDGSKLVTEKEKEMSLLNKEVARVKELLPDGISEEDVKQRKEELAKIAISNRKNLCVL